jgi:benzoate-CoA ligase
VKLLDENEQPVRDEDGGEMYLNAPSMAAYYWNKREKSRESFQGVWYRTGDRYVRDSDGYYYYQARADDMFKSSSNWVSPIEVESVLLSHEAVAQAAVIGCEDTRAGRENTGQVPAAFVVLKPSHQPSDALRDELQAFSRDRLAPNFYKYPRLVEFVDDLPRTAGGKIQRFKLRERVSSFGGT